MTTIFDYTRTAPVNSSAVDAVYYDDTTKRLAVVLNSADTYAYDNVPSQEFNALVNGPSVGRHYALGIKRNYGPGEYLGYGSNVAFVQGVEAPSMAAVSDVTTATSGSGSLHVGVPLTEGGTISASRLTGLRLAPNTVVETTPAAQEKFDLAQTVEKTSKFTVQFKDAFERDREYTLDALSDEDAVDALVEVADMLGVDVTPVAVTRYL